jgi:hypothetical protein
MTDSTCPRRVTPRGGVVGLRIIVLDKKTKAMEILHLVWLHQFRTTAQRV